MIIVGILYLLWQRPPVPQAMVPTNFIKALDREWSDGLVKGSMSDRETQFPSVTELPPFSGPSCADDTSQIVPMPSL